MHTSILSGCVWPPRQLSQELATVRTRVDRLGRELTARAQRSESLLLASAREQAAHTDEVASELAAKLAKVSSSLAATTTTNSHLGSHAHTAAGGSGSMTTGGFSSGGAQLYKYRLGAPAHNHSHASNSANAANGGTGFGAVAATGRLQRGLSQRAAGAALPRINSQTQAHQSPSHAQSGAATAATVADVINNSSAADATASTASGPGPGPDGSALRPPSRPSAPGALAAVLLSSPSPLAPMQRGPQTPATVGPAGVTAAAAAPRAQTLLSKGYTQSLAVPHGSAGVIISNAHAGAGEDVGGTVSARSRPPSRAVDLFDLTPANINNSVASGDGNAGFSRPHSRSQQGLAATASVSATGSGSASARHGDSAHGDLLAATTATLAASALPSAAGAGRYARLRGGGGAHGGAHAARHGDKAALVLPAQAVAGAVLTGSAAGALGGRF